jgi:hypothetical protein
MFGGGMLGWVRVCECGEESRCAFVAVQESRVACMAVESRMRVWCGRTEGRGNTGRRGGEGTSGKLTVRGDGDVSAMAVLCCAV